MDSQSNFCALTIAPTKSPLRIGAPAYIPRDTRRRRRRYGTRCACGQAASDEASSVTLPFDHGADRKRNRVSLQPEASRRRRPWESTATFNTAGVRRPRSSSEGRHCITGNATGLVAGAMSMLGQSGRFVQLHPDSLKAIKQGHLIPGSDGFFRMMTRGTDKKFLHQLQWKPAPVNPAQLMSAQMIAVQLALKTAVGEITDAVNRVEGNFGRIFAWPTQIDR